MVLNFNQVGIFIYSLKFILLFNLAFFNIIIPVFEPSINIYSCIYSIINQSFSDWEILIIDGSNSMIVNEFISKEGGHKIQGIFESDNGVYDAMNKGIKISKGQWIYFLGSDDVLHDEFVLENIYKSIKLTKLPIIYGNVKILGDTGWARDGEIYAGHFSKNRMLRKAICHQAIFYNREFLISNNLLFDLKYPVSADWQFNLRCRRLTSFKYVDQIVALFSAGGISTVKKDSFQENIKIEFGDIFPTKLEIILKEIAKKFIRLIK